MYFVLFSPSTLAFFRFLMPAHHSWTTWLLYFILCFTNFLTSFCSLLTGHLSLRSSLTTEHIVNHTPLWSPPSLPPSPPRLSLSPASLPPLSPRPGLFTDYFAHCTCYHLTSYICFFNFCFLPLDYKFYNSWDFVWFMDIYLQSLGQTVKLCN